MEIFLNGKPHSTECATLDQLVEEQGVNGKGLIVELNREIVNSGSWKERPLKQGDMVEILGFVGGG